MIIKEIRKNTKCAMSSKRRDICHFVWGRGIYYNDLERFYLSINSKELCDEVFSRYRNTFSGRNPAIMYTRLEQRAGTGNAGSSDINMWQLFL